MEDVIIVGAGLGGLMAAVTLAESGVSPLVLEKSSGVGMKVCGELASSRLYGMSIEDYSKESIRREFKCIDFRVGRNEFSLDYKSKSRGFRSNPSSWVSVDRKILETELYERASKAGARFKFSYPVKDIEKVSNGVRVQDFETRLLIGSDGCFSRVRQFTLQETREFAIPISCLVKTKPEWTNPILFLGKDIIPGGYGWIFPHGKTSDVGVGHLVGQVKTRYFFDRFVSGMDLLSEVRGGTVPVSFPYKTVFDRVLLVGDSAGVVDSLVGAGINSAMVSGKLAGETAIKAIGTGKFGYSSLKEYEESWKKLMYWKLVKCRLLRDLVYKGILRSNVATSVVLECIL